jgi:hypothetical protein
MGPRGAGVLSDDEHPAPISHPLLREAAAALSEGMLAARFHDACGFDPQGTRVARAWSDAPESALVHYASSRGVALHHLLLLIDAVACHEDADADLTSLFTRGVDAIRTLSASSRGLADDTCVADRDAIAASIGALPHAKVIDTIRGTLTALPSLGVPKLWSETVERVVECRERTPSVYFFPALLMPEILKIVSPPLIVHPDMQAVGSLDEGLTISGASLLSRRGEDRSDLIQEFIPWAQSLDVVASLCYSVPHQLQCKDLPFLGPQCDAPAFGAPCWLRPKPTVPCGRDSVLNQLFAEQ